MLRRRIFFQNLVQRDRSTNGSKILGTSNRKNLKSKSTDGGYVGKGSSAKRKMRHLSFGSEEGRVMKKRRIGKNDGADNRNADIDRISELPEPIIHHILSFIRCAKDVVRTSILSKRWKIIFDSYPLFDFDERRFRLRGGKGKHNRIKAREIQRKKFMSYVEKSLALKLDSIPSIDKFRLYVKNTSELMRASMRKWICLAVKKNVKELDIYFDTKVKLFVFPCEVFVSQSITSLKLSGSTLFGFTATQMSNLRELSIKDTTLVNEFTIKKFEEGCPLLEDLRLVRCPGLLNLAILALLKLRRLEVHECNQLTSVEIEAANLETFWYYSGKHQLSKINLKGSGNLKNLTLKDWGMTETVFQDCISKCPVLEKLVLQECNSMKTLTILSGKLRHLALFRCAQLYETNIDTPNLYSFEYCGHRLPFSSMNVSGLCQAKFSFGPTMITTQRIVDYQKLFGNFDQCKDFKLILSSKQTMKIYEEPREARLIRHFYHKFELTKSLASVLKIVDNWLRECHGKILVVVAPSSELTKRIHSLIMDRGDNPNCCGFMHYSNKCWRHYLADVKISTSNRMHKTYYEFKWRSRQSR